MATIPRHAVKLAPLLPLASLTLAVAAAAQPLAKPDLAKGSATYNAMCAACHAPDGNSEVPAQPKLAQQHPEYLLKQLKAYKSGQREDPVMQGFAAALSEEDMRDVAYWLASQKARPGEASNGETLALGERIYRGGIADRRIAACASCHSPNGAGLPPQYPRLAGQHADYLATQLQQFRSGKRSDQTMTDVAAKMTDAEIKAVADYMAGLR